MINYHKVKSISYYNGLGQIKDGDWDLVNMVDYTHFGSFTLLDKRFRLGFSWSLIDSKLDNGLCLHMDELFKCILKDGYLPKTQQHKARGGGLNLVEGFVKHPRARFKAYLEPLVAIGREGEILYLDGSTRLSIAIILGYNEVPVNVVARHWAFHRIRQEICHARCIDDLQRYARWKGHPDIIGIYPDFS